MFGQRNYYPVSQKKKNQEELHFPNGQLCVVEESKEEESSFNFNQFSNITFILYLLPLLDLKSAHSLSLMNKRYHKIMNGEDAKPWKMLHAIRRKEKQLEEVQEETATLKKRSWWPLLSTLLGIGIGITELVYIISVLPTVTVDHQHHHQNHPHHHHHANTTIAPEAMPGVILGSFGSVLTMGMGVVGSVKLFLFNEKRQRENLREMEALERDVALNKKKLDQSMYDSFKHSL